MRVSAACLSLLIAASCARGQEDASDSGGPGMDGSSTSDGPHGGDAATDAPSGPKPNPMWPPYNLTWSNTGDLGRAGGLTWGYSGIQRGSLKHIYWILCDDPTETPCGLSLNGPISAPEQWAFDATNSDLPSGKIVFTNSTSLLLADGSTTPLSGRLTVTLVDSGNSAIPVLPVAMLGVMARTGQYGAEIKGTGFTVKAIAEVEDTMTSTWTPYLDYYDSKQTPGDAGTADAGGNAYVSFGGSFYDD